MPSLANNYQCTGCTACYSSCPRNCITMQQDKYGFMYPVIDSAVCINCKKCESVCPVIVGNQESTNVPLVYAAYLLDERIRMESSSGGIFSLIANEILSQGGAVFGAIYDKQYRIKHVCIQETSELSALRGAKYAQSNLNNCFADVQRRLKARQKVMFVGTPCQVAGLKTFLKKEYQELFTADFVCHGVPAPLAWEKYVQYRAKKDNNGVLPTNINLRSKKTGWSQYKYSNQYIYSNDKSYSSLSGDDLFMRLFVGDYINRDSCANCCFKGYKRKSDITLGDFWGIWDIAPEMDDNKGTSLVLVHSDNARDMVKQISDKVVMQEFTLRQACAQNPSLLFSSSAAHERIQVLEQCIGGEFDEIAEFLTKKEAKKLSYRSLIARVFKKIKRIFISAKL